ncbi:MAG: hypothetical protein DBX40_07250 [Clostridiales bacterium]|nr:MAG: hypothetical protein DBX40_07250 [Clostridiales bacterium]
MLSALLSLSKKHGEKSFLKIQKSSRHVKQKIPSSAAVYYCLICGINIRV